MKVLIAGGSGFLGNPLAWTWAEEEHDVRVLTRGLPPGVGARPSGRMPLGTEPPFVKGRPLETAA